MTETILRQIEILTKAWDTISNMSINKGKLRTKQYAVLDKLTEQILEKADIYLNSGQVNEYT